MMATRKTRTSSRHQYVHASYVGCRHSQIRRNSNCSIDTCSRWLSLASISGVPLPCTFHRRRALCRLPAGLPGAARSVGVAVRLASVRMAVIFPRFRSRIKSFVSGDLRSLRHRRVRGVRRACQSGNPSLGGARERAGRRTRAVIRTSAGRAGWAPVCSGGHVSGGSPSRSGAWLRAGAPPGIRFRLNGHLAYSSAGDVTARIYWSGSTGRSSDAPTSSASSPARAPRCAWSGPFWWNKTMSGRLPGGGTLVRGPWRASQRRWR